MGMCYVWNRYKKDVKHVLGHITGEDLEHVIMTVAPNNVIIHHTSAHGENKAFNLSNGVSRLNPKDGDTVGI